MRPELRRLLLRLGVIAALSVLLVLSALPKSATLIYSWPWVFYGQLLLLVPIVLLAVSVLHSDWRGERHWLALAAPPLTALVSAAFSRRPAFSFEVALLLCSMAALSAYIAGVISSWSELNNKRASLLRAARITGVLVLVPLVSGIGLWFSELATASQYYSSIGEWAAKILLYRNLHPFGHWNYVGGYALLALTCFVGLSIAESGRWRATWVAASALALLTLASSGSRGAVLGLAAAGAAGLLIALCAKALSTRTAIRIAAVALLGIAAIIVAVPRLRESVANMGVLLAPNDGDVQRISMLQAGRLLVHKSPWIGHGPGMTPFVYPEVRADVVGGVETAYQLHNGPLQVAVDSGLLGVAAWLVLVLVLAMQAIRWIRLRPADEIGRALRTFALTAPAGLAGYAVMFVTDYQLDVLPIAALSTLLVGIALARPAARTHPGVGVVSRRRLCSRIAATGLALFALAALAIMAPAWRARQAFWRAWEESESKQDPRVVLHLREAAALQPRNPYYLTQLGLRLAINAGTASDQNAAEALRSEALGLLEQSLTIDPAQEPVHAALGWLLLPSNPQLARGHFAKALQLIPDRDTLHLGLAFSALGLGDRAGAVHELALECIVSPSFHAWPLWMQDPFLNLRPEVMACVSEYYALALQDATVTSWQKANIAYAAAFHRWWLGGSVPSGAELMRATPAQRHFFEALEKGMAPQPTAGLKSPAALEVLAVAASGPSSAEQLLGSLRPRISEPAIAGALARLQAGIRGVDALIRAPAPGGIGIVTQSMDRGHYSIMNRVLDGPGYPDPAPRVLDLFTVEFVQPLLPARGYAPTAVLLKLGAAR